LSDWCKSSRGGTVLAKGGIQLWRSLLVGGPFSIVPTFLVKAPCCNTWYVCKQPVLFHETDGDICWNSSRRVVVLTNIHLPAAEEVECAGSEEAGPSMPPPQPATEKPMEGEQDKLSSELGVNHVHAPTICESPCFFSSKLHFPTKCCLHQHKSASFQLEGCIGPKGC
jgi:hypothetical protein